MAGAAAAVVCTGKGRDKGGRNRLTSPSPSFSHEVIGDETDDRGGGTAAATTVLNGRECRDGLLEWSGSSLPHALGARDTGDACSTSRSRSPSARSARSAAQWPTTTPSVSPKFLDGPLGVGAWDGLASTTPSSSLSSPHADGRTGGRINGEAAVTPPSPPPSFSSLSSSLPQADI